jgi:serine/threonine protein kinase
VFFEGAVYTFDLEDLLRASAEVLGKGSVGTSYKAVLEEGTTVVVKRLKDVAVTKREFEMQMEVLGKIKHDNVVPLRAFYFSKDEKLLVSDFMPAGSLSALLHGNHFEFLFPSFSLKFKIFTTRLIELLIEKAPAVTAMETIYGSCLIG